VKRCCANCAFSRGKVFVHGEIWDAVASSDVTVGQSVVVRRIDGLLLQVEPLAVALARNGCSLVGSTHQRNNQPGPISAPPRVHWVTIRLSGTCVPGGVEA